MNSVVVSIDWQETAKCPVGVYALLPGRGLCHVLAAEGLDRIVGYRQHVGAVVRAITERISVRRLRALDPWGDLTGARACATLRDTQSISTPTSLRYINDTR